MEVKPLDFESRLTPTPDLEDIPESADLEVCQAIMAVLEVHKRHPECRLRFLLENVGVNMNPILTSYVAAFGVHGEAVVNRFLKDKLFDREHFNNKVAYYIQTLLKKI